MQTRVIWTNHANERFLERFPSLNKDEEWSQASFSRIGKRTRAKIRKICAGHSHLVGSDFRGFYYKISKNNILFVVTPPYVIVTVMPLEEKQNTKQTHE